MRAAFLILCILLRFPALGAETCKFEYENWAPGTSPRDLQGKATVLFPDGRRFELIGHNHGASSEKAELINDVYNKETSNTKYLSAIRSRLAISETAIRHAERELKYLREKLPERKGQFIALETTEFAAPMTLGLTGWIDASAAAEFKRRKISDSNLRRSITLLSGGAVGFLNLNEPGLVKNQKIMGVDHPDIENYLQDVAKAEEKWAVLAAAAKDDEKFRKDLGDTRQELFDQYYVLDQITDEQLLEHSRAKVPPKYWTKFEAWVREELQNHRTTIRRDKHILDKMLAEKTSGTLIIGFAHLRSLSISLLQKCEEAKQQAPASAPPTESPTTGK